MFDEAIPHYLAMGMTWDEFWDGEYGTKRAFRKAYRIRMENEQKLADRNNWYMGQYLISALQCVPLLVAGLNVKRTTKLPSYPEQPFLEKFEKQQKEEVRKRKEEDQSKMAMALFQAMTLKFNKNIERRLEKEKQKATDTGQ